MLLRAIGYGLGLALSCFYFWYFASELRSGVASVPFKSFKRSQHPYQYWSTIAVHALIALAVMAVVAFRIVRDLWP